VENVFPPVPADTFVLLGAFLSAAGRADPWLVLLFTWVPNVGSALLVYGLARRWGDHFFEHRIGRWLLHPGQLEQIDSFYFKWGPWAIFASRFLPAFRAMVPVFAGVTDLPLRRVFVPLAGASLLWYGLIVLLGSFAGRNLGRVLELFASVNTVLLVVAGVLIAAFLVWWWRTRHPH
jgi:membrane protein DedA with SNARE-associated domain